MLKIIKISLCLLVIAPIVFFVYLNILVFLEPEPSFSTTPPLPETIKKNNQIRKELGIRQIKDNWHFNKRQFNAEDWKDIQGGGKRVQYDDEYKVILWEQDYYYSGHSFICDDDPDAGKGHEMLSIKYDYKTKQFSVYVTTDDPKFPKPFGCFISLKQADEILGKWRLNRL